MKIEKLTKGQKELVRDLYRLCFSGTFDSDYFNAYIDSSDLWDFVWGVVKDDLLISSYVAYEGKVKIRSVPFDVHYFDGFVTRPGYRNKGMGRKLFENQRVVADEKGIKLFALDPFKNSYYKQFGFEDAFDFFRIELPMRTMSTEKIEDLYETETISAFHSEKALNGLREIYDREWKEGIYNPMCLPDAYFMGMFNRKTWKVLLLKDEFQKVIGSLIYEIKERTMTVYKMSFFDLKGILTFRDFLTQFKDQMDIISLFKAPPDFPVDVFAETFHAGSSHINMQAYPTRMMQILDIEYAINRILPMLELPKEPIEIRFTDRHIKANNKTLSISETGVKVIQKKACNLMMEVSDFVPVFTGRYSFSEQFSKGKFKMKSVPNPSWNKELHPYIIRRLDNVFPKTVTHNNEFCF